MMSASNRIRNKNGMLEMKSGRRWKSYDFRVSGSTYFHYFKDREAKAHGEILIHTITKVDVPLVKDSKVAFPFSVHFSGKGSSPWILNASSNEERFSWMETIKPGSSTEFFHRYEQSPGSLSPPRSSVGAAGAAGGKPTSPAHHPHPHPTATTTLQYQPIHRPTPPTTPRRNATMPPGHRENVYGRGPTSLSPPSPGPGTGPPPVWTRSPPHHQHHTPVTQSLSQPPGHSAAAAAAASAFNEPDASHLNTTWPSEGPLSPTSAQPYVEPIQSVRPSSKQPTPTPRSAASFEKTKSLPEIEGGYTLMKPSPVSRRQFTPENEYLEMMDASAQQGATNNSHPPHPPPPSSSSPPSSPPLDPAMESIRQLQVTVDQVAKDLPPEQVSKLVEMLSSLQLSSSSPQPVQKKLVSLLSNSKVNEKMLVTEEDEGYYKRPDWAKAVAVQRESESDIPELQVEALYLPRSSVTDLEVIGKGQFGEVFKGLFNKGSPMEKVVAVKTIKKTSEADKACFMKEMATMSQMMHPNIVRLYGIVKDDTLPSPWIVLEFLPNGDLKNFLTNNSRPAHKLVSYMMDVAMGMHYISERGLVHRDLAARNVLVGAGEMCKVADFGLLRELPKGDAIYVSHSSVPSPVRWMAPESIKDRTFSPASDVWSFGVLQWEMFNPSKLPYPTMSNMQVVMKVAEGFRLPSPRGCPPVVTRIMKSCWHSIPEKRPSFLVISTLLMQGTLQ